MPAVAESGDRALPEGHSVPETPLVLSPHLPRFQSALLRGKKSGQSREVHKEPEGELDVSVIHNQTVIETEK